MADVALRIGLIGYGAWGSHHAQAIAGTAGAELAAIAVRSAESQQAARKAFPNARVTGDYRELAQMPDLDAVDVVLPSNLHFEVGSYVLECGKHLLMEKPLTLSVEHCQRLVELAQSRKLCLAVGHEMRLASLWSKVKQLIDDGTIGRPLYVLVELSRRPYRQGSEGWRYDISRVGNWILEEPIHFFDLARWYLVDSGDPVSLYARANSRQADHPELQDNFSAIVNFAGGAYAVISQTLAAFEHHQTVKITGTKGAAWAWWSGAMDRTLHPTFGLKLFDGNEVKEFSFERPTGEVFELADQMAAFVKAIRSGGQPAATGRDGTWSVGLCLAAQQSVDRGAPVSLDHLTR